MATDLVQIVSTLRRFYTFAGKRVILVGGGGGSLLDAVCDAEFVTAIDPDRGAMDHLAQYIRRRGWAGKFLIVDEEFVAAQISGGVVLFEFALHEMPDPLLALEHAQRLAPETVVIDHAPGSKWSWYANEDGQVAAAWSAIPRDHVSRLRDYAATQVFATPAELQARMAGRDGVALERIAPLLVASGPVEIPMPYRIALLRGARDSH